MDTHISRVTKRLGIANENDDVITIENKLYNIIPKNRLNKAHHQLVLFGRYYCKSKNPLCNNCKLKDMCKKNEV